jgi:hypothetical protein
MNALSRKLASASAALLVAAVLLGCPLLKKKGQDAGAGDDDTSASASVADAATVKVEGSGATNEKDVLRYAKEEKLADEPAVIAKDGVKVRTFPGGGAEVATLGKDTHVTKVAKYFGSGVLIVWDGVAGKTMGWVPPSALAAPATAATATAATTAVVKPSDAGVRVVDAGARTDAGAADAGARVADAGAIAAVDAGAGGPKATQISYPPDAKGACPPLFIKSGPMCKRRCMIDAECPRGTFCSKDVTPTQILKVCSTEKR